MPRARERKFGGTSGSVPNSFFAVNSGFLPKVREHLLQTLLAAQGRQGIFLRQGADGA
jgi:hypothetical protein